MVKDRIIRFEHQKLKIGENGFTKKHFNAFVKLNNLHGNKYFTVLHNGIQFKEYVGVIQSGGLTIEIHPKADKFEDESQWKDVLLDMLKACNKLSPKSSGTANVKRQNLDLLEIYFELFINEIDALIRQGLIKKYRRETKNITALKGKLEFAGQIRKNFIHKERFYTTHQVYDTNHLIHQTLSIALKIVDLFNKNNKLSGKIFQIQFSYPEVKKIKVDATTFDKILLNRKSKPYTNALALARLIILNYSPDISFGKEKMISLLFNMNDLWEQYVLIQVKNYLRNENSSWQVTGQESKRFIKNHTLRPDIVLKNDTTNETIIIDTKWKLGDRHVSVQDLRQVYTYGKYWKANKVMLLYPGKQTNYRFEEYVNTYDDNKLYCKLGFVSVLNSEGKLSSQLAKNIFNLLEIK